MGMLVEFASLHALSVHLCKLAQVCDSGFAIRQGRMMQAPSTPVKCEHNSTLNAARTLATGFTSRPF